MLVLTRKVGELVAIGKAIKLKIISVKGNRVRIGLDAPDDVPILRHELLDTVPPPYTDET